MGHYDRRAFAKVAGGIVGLVSLPRAAAAAQTDKASSENQPAIPLTEKQRQEYAKSLPDRDKALGKLNAQPLAYGLEPDFVFRAALAPGAPPPASRRRGRR